MTDPLRDAFARAAEAVAPDVALSRCHPAAIGAQAGQVVDVIVEDGGPLPSASGLRLIYGVPGISCTIKTGQRVRMAYENGDARKPIACGFDPFVRDSELPIQDLPVTELNICGGSPSQGAARNGDAIAGGTLSWAPTPPIGPTPTGGLLTYTPAPSAADPAPLPTVWSVVGPVVITQLSPPSPTPSITLSGAITSGSAVVRIGG